MCIPCRAKTRLSLDQHNLADIEDTLLGFRNGYPYEYEPAWGRSNIYGVMKHLRENIIESDGKCVIHYPIIIH